MNCFAKRCESFLCDPQASVRLWNCSSCSHNYYTWGFYQSPKLCQVLHHFSLDGLWTLQNSDLTRQQSPCCLQREVYFDVDTFEHDSSSSFRDYPPCFQRLSTATIDNIRVDIRNCATEKFGFLKNLSSLLQSAADVTRDARQKIWFLG